MAARQGVRTHNEFQVTLSLHRPQHKPEFIDAENERMLDEIAKKHKEGEKIIGADRYKDTLIDIQNKKALNHG